MRTALSLKAKLAILSAIPMCCAVGLGLYLTFDRAKQMREFASFEDAMALANLIAEMNEANNEELGNAWCWTSTAIDENGVAVVQEIRDLWEAKGEALDAQYEKMVAFRDSMDLQAYDSGLADILQRVDASISKLSDHRENMRRTMDYEEIIVPYVELKDQVQAIYPALLKETSDKALSQKITSYNIFLDYHTARVQYTGVMIWAHQIPELPPGGYARYESYHRESETLLKHFRNLAVPDLVARVDSILESPRGRWVDEKVRSFLTNGQFHDFSAHKELEAEFKSKGEGLNVELGELMQALRDDIMAYTATRIDGLRMNRNLTALITLLIVGFSVGFNTVFGARITKAMAEISTGIANGASQVHAAAQQITQASDTLAKSSCSQAASVEETTAMIAHILSTTNSTTENAKQATAMIQSTSSVIEESSLTMAEMNRSIQKIAANSEETKKIMSTINDIAFQTNILALNAAVEAARAGESGAGFAVVADEVRTLAQRSSAASENTNTLIESSNSSISSGTDCADRANRAFAKVLKSAQDVFERVSKIDADAVKQAQAIAEISQAAEKVDKATHSNAASAEQCAASAASLNRQAAILDDHVNSLTEMIYGPAKATRRRVTRKEHPTAVRRLPVRAPSQPRKELSEALFR